MKSLTTLTNQEHVVLALVAKGWRNTKIAHELCISSRTVENHLYHIFDKLGVSSRTEAALYALQTGWLKVEMSGNSHDAAGNNAYARQVN
jgi:DNA-binding NarL/FixJ family response regulator